MADFINESYILIQCLLTGFVCAVIYDIIVALLLGKNNPVFDVIYCPIAGYRWFKMLYIMNNGAIRIIYIVVTIIGIIMYVCLFGKSVRTVFGGIRESIKSTHLRHHIDNKKTNNK